jgi:hypothetical protein
VKSLVLTHKNEVRSNSPSPDNSLVTRSDFSNTSFHSDELVGLPIGVLVCSLTADGGELPGELRITYGCKEAQTLLITGSVPVEGRFLHEIPFLSSYIDNALDVIQTGFSFVTYGWNEGTGCQIEVAIHKAGEGCVCYLKDHSKPLSSEQNLQNRLHLEAIVAGISTRLISVEADAFDALLIDCLQQIGQFNGADRVYIFNFSDDGQLMSCTHEWCAPGIVSQQALQQNESTRLFTWWHQTLVAGKTIFIKSLDELPPQATAEKENLVGQEIKSILVVPVLSANTLTGFIGFDAVRQERDWDKNDIHLLTTFAGLVTTTNSRIRHQRLLQQTNDRLNKLNRISQALLDCSLSDQQPA